MKKKTKKNLKLGIGLLLIVIIGIIAFGYMQASFHRTNHLINYTLSDGTPVTNLKLVQDIPFYAKLNVGENVESFSVIPIYDASTDKPTQSHHTCCTHIKLFMRFDIFNYETNSWELIEQQDFNLPITRERYAIIRSYDTELYSSPDKMAYISRQRFRDDNKDVMWYACLPGAKLPADFRRDNSLQTLVEHKCIYPGTFVDISESGRDQNHYTYVVNSYFYSNPEKYVRDGYADIRITYRGNMDEPYTSLTPSPNDRAKMFVHNKTMKEVVTIIDEEVIVEEEEIEVENPIVEETESETIVIIDDELKIINNSLIYSTFPTNTTCEFQEKPKGDCKFVDAPYCKWICSIQPTRTTNIVQTVLPRSTLARNFFYVIGGLIVLGLVVFLLTTRKGNKRRKR